MIQFLPQNLCLFLDCDSIINNVFAELSCWDPACVKCIDVCIRSVLVLRLCEEDFKQNENLDANKEKHDFSSLTELIGVDEEGEDRRQEEC